MNLTSNALAEPGVDLHLELERANPAAKPAA